jgi:hypothetical protein
MVSFRYTIARGSQILTLAALPFFFLPVSSRQVDAAVIIQRPLYIGLTNGLVGYRSFDGQDINVTEALDRSGEGNDGTLTNGPVRTAGKLGQGMNFHGPQGSTHPYVDIGNVAALQLTGSMSISAWVRRSSDTIDDEHIISKADNGNGWQFKTSLDCTSRRLAMYITADGGGTHAERCGSTVLTTDRWYHVVGVFNASQQTLDLYLDGVRDTGAMEATSGSIPSSMTDSGSKAVIGCAARDPVCNYSSAGFPGVLDDVRVYNRALSAAEVKRLYKIGGTMKINGPNSSATLSNGLLGHWTFDGSEMGPTNALDRTANGNNGTLVSGPKPTIGKLGQALSFDGLNDYVEVSNPNSLEISGAKISIAFWINPNDTGTDVVVLHKAWANDTVSSNPYEYGIELNGTDHAFDFFFNTDATGALNGPFGASTAARFGEWQHVAFTYDGANVRQYIDGVLVATTAETDSLGTNGFGDTEFKIAVDPAGGQAAKMLLDDVRIYNRALSAEEIKRLHKLGGTYTLNKTQDPSLTTLGNGLVGYWPFDGGDVMYTSIAGGSGSTGAAAPSTNAAVAGRGDGDGFETTTLGGDLASIDNAGLTSRNTGSGNATDGCSTFPQNEDDYHYFTDFNLSVPAGATISGITVTVTASSTVTGTNLICVGLSPDGGTSTTSAQSTGDVAGTPTTYTLGSASDTWGRTWSSTEFSNANFRVYLMPDPNNANTRTFFVDQVTVNVAYSTGSGGVTPSTAIDRSGQGNNGTLTNGPQATIGKLGQALQFDGVDSVVQTAQSSTFDLTFASSKYSYGFWVRPDTLTENKQSFAICNGLAGFKIYVHTATDVNDGPVTAGVTALYYANSFVDFHSTNNVVSIGSWYHVLVIFDGAQSSANKITIYVNGVDVTDRSDIASDGTPTDLNTGNCGVQIGGNENDGSFAKAIIDDVRVYNRTLSADEVKRLYTMGNPN